MIFHNGAVADVMVGDCLESLRRLPDCSAHMCVTSPPYYGLRDYRRAGQIGLEDTPDAYVARLVEVFREVRRVLTDDGTLWLNIGDSYARDPGKGGSGPGGKNGAYSGAYTDAARIRSESNGSSDGAVRRGDRAALRVGGNGLKSKDLIGIPWMLAFALRADGWYLRQEIIWNKPNPMPESVTDRCTKAHESVFLLSKSARYFFDHEAIKEPAIGSTGGAPKKIHDLAAQGRHGVTSALNRPWAGSETRNKRSVWTVAPKPYAGAHFAVYPPELIAPCILAGCPPAGKRCDCDEIIATPTGSGGIDDPSFEVGRAGMARPRRENEGVRPITRREQRHHAEQMKASPHRLAMELGCGDAFAHYTRTDRGGARPLPEAIRQAFLAEGWLTDASPCDCPVMPAGVVLDPFGGSGTTAGVSLAHGRNAILCELNSDYAALMPDRAKYIIDRTVLEQTKTVLARIERQLEDAA